MAKSKMTNAEKVAAVAQAVNGTVYENYSGRCMYGRTCFGVTCKYPDSAIAEGKKRGLRNAKQDNMGLSFIVYWESCK